MGFWGSLGESAASIGGGAADFLRKTVDLTNYAADSPIGSLLFNKNQHDSTTSYVPEGRQPYITHTPQVVAPVSRVLQPAGTIQPGGASTMMAGNNLLMLAGAGIIGLLVFKMVK